MAAIVVFSLAITGCSDEDPIENIVEGPSSNDVLTVPTDAAYLGDSIRHTKTYSLANEGITKVTVSTTQNGHISVLGGYKDVSAVYVYAKVDDDRHLSDEQIASILEKYYDIESYVYNTEMIASVTEKDNIAHGDDYHSLRISVKVFAPRNVSTSLNVNKGSIFASNVWGNEHNADLVAGSVKYLDSYGKTFDLNVDAGHMAVVNTTASESINALLGEGNMQFVLPKKMKATLDLESVTKVNAYILNNSNFKGTNSHNRVVGELNGGGFKLNANSGTGVILLRWYDR